jgi:hypothetical protein
MRRRWFAFASCLALPAVSADAQAPASTPPAYFEFQVEQQARYVAEPSARGFRPAAPRMSAEQAAADSVVAQFIVDTAGVPIAGTLRMLRSPSDAVTAQVQAAYAGWRFRPARLDGRPVPQLVQTAVEWGGPPADRRG